MALKDDPQYEYKLALRDWMKRRGLSMRWLASWIEKSETTVKNFLYGTRPISEENQEKIEALQAEYEDGEDINCCLPSNHRLIISNPNFDPVPKKQELSDIKYSILFIKENTHARLKDLNILSINKKTDTSWDYDDIIYLYADSFPDVEEMLREIIKKTIRSYMDEKGIDISSIAFMGGAKFFEDENMASDYYKTEVSKIAVPLDIIRYAGLAAKMAGSSYADPWIESVVLEWANQKRIEEVSNFLDL